MQAFTYVALPFRVVFGAGRIASLGDELDVLGAERALFCASPGRTGEVERVSRSIEDRCVGISANAEPFTPIECVREALDHARDLAADSVVSYGGGNAIGLAKVLADELDVPFIAIPTTYSGSETTTLQAVREDGKRVQLASPKMLPKSIIYDAELTLGLSADIAVPSGFNSMAQGVSSFFAETSNPIGAMTAEGGIRAMASALERIAKDPDDPDARGDALYGAFLCGSTIMASGTTLQHKACHVLAGDFKLTHAKTHTIMLPHVANYNRASVAGAEDAIARAFGGKSGDGPGAIFDTMLRCGAPTALRDIGMKEEDLDRAAELTVTNPYYNPRTYERDAIRQMLDDAYFGRRPN